MRVFRLSDGTNWVARLVDGSEEPQAGGVGWEAILLDTDPAAVAQKLVYRPTGWLASASPADLAAALEEGVVVRARWGRPAV